MVCRDSPGPLIRREATNTHGTELATVDQGTSPATQEKYKIARLRFKGEDHHVSEAVLSLWQWHQLHM